MSNARPRVNIRIKLENLLCLFALGLLFIDSLTGFFVLKIGIDLKISILYKLFFIVICLVYLLSSDRKIFIVIFSICSYVIVWTLLQNITTSPEFLIKDFGEMLKLVSTIVVFSTFHKFKYVDCRNFASKFFFITLLVLIFNVLMSIIGIGSTSYGTFGAKGFFYAANALSGVIVILASFYFCNFKERGEFTYFLIFISFLVLSAVIGTKSGILGVIVIFILLSVFRFRLTLKKIIFSSVFFIPILCASIYYGFSLVFETQLYVRIIHFYDTGGLVRALLSDRDQYFYDVYPSFLSADMVNILFGLGNSNLSNIFKGTVEIDLIDITLMFGFFTFSAYIIFMTIIFINIFSVSNVNDDVTIKLKYSAILSSAVLILISLFAGHILFNGVVTFIWGISLALPLWRKNNFIIYNGIIGSDFSEDRKA